MLEASGGAPTVCFWAWTLALLAKRIRQAASRTRLIIDPPGINLRWLNQDASTAARVRQKPDLLPATTRLDMQLFGCILSRAWMRSSRRSRTHHDGRCWTG